MSGYLFRKDLRRCVIFGRNDLVQDAPISRIDLLLCRNTLMHFTAEAQRQILRRFQFALADHGYLMLGRSEMLTGRSQLFTPVDLKRRVFRRVERAPSRHRDHRVTSAATSLAPAITGERLAEAAFEAAPTAQVILDAEGTLVMANDRARRMFAITGRDSGRPIQDLEVSYRPVELRSHLDVVIAELRSVAVRGVRSRQEGTERSFDVQLVPILSDGVLTGMAITYEDVTEARQLREELSRSKCDLETAAEELQATVEELETTNAERLATHEELETMNEELKSASEELETMNEELKSANEELETMNEELKSANEELETMNEELRHR
jgi:two-component system CheB/CheR fusion protein